MRRREFAVIGLGRFGSSVARTLHEAGYQVLAVDKSEQKVQAMVDHCSHVVQADATNEDVLNSLGLRNFDVAVVAIGNDWEASIMVTVMLKDMGVPEIVTKATSHMHGRILRRVGATRVVFPEMDMGVRLARSLAAQNLMDYIELTPDVSIMELEADGKIVGQDLRTLNLRAKYGVTILAIRRGNQVMVSIPPTEKIRAGDILVAIGENKDLEKLENLLA